MLLTSDTYDEDSPVNSSAWASPRDSVVSPTPACIASESISALENTVAGSPSTSSPSTYRAYHDPDVHVPTSLGTGTCGPVRRACSSDESPTRSVLVPSIFGPTYTHVEAIRPASGVPVSASPTRSTRPVVPYSPAPPHEVPMFSPTCRGDRQPESFSLAQDVAEALQVAIVATPSSPIRLSVREIASPVDGGRMLFANCDMSPTAVAARVARTTTRSRGSPETVLETVLRPLPVATRGTINSPRDGLRDVATPSSSATVLDDNDAGSHVFPHDVMHSGRLSGDDYVDLESDGFRTELDNEESTERSPLDGDRDDDAPQSPLHALGENMRGFVAQWSQGEQPTAGSRKVLEEKLLDISAAAVHLGKSEECAVRKLTQELEQERSDKAEVMASLACEREKTAELEARISEMETKHASAPLCISRYGPKSAPTPNGEETIALRMADLAVKLAHNERQMASECDVLREERDSWIEEVQRMEQDFDGMREWYGEREQRLWSFYRTSLAKISDLTNERTMQEPRQGEQLAEARFSLENARANLEWDGRRSHGEVELNDDIVFQQKYDVEKSLSDAVASILGSEGFTDHGARSTKRDPGKCKPPVPTRASLRGRNTAPACDALQQATRQSLVNGPMIGSTKSNAALLGMEVFRLHEELLCARRAHSHTIKNLSPESGFVAKEVSRISRELSDAEQMYNEQKDLLIHAREKQRRCVRNTIRELFDVTT